MMTTKSKPERRTSILNAAAQLFGQQGFDGTSLAAIAKKAGVQKTHVQYYFDNKDDLWKAAVTHIWAQRNQVLPQYLAQFADNDTALEPDNMIRELCQIILSFTFEHPEWVKIMFQESSTPGPRLDWLVTHFIDDDFKQGSALIELGQSQGLLPQVNPIDLLHILSGALIYLVNVAPITERVLNVQPNSDAYMQQHIDSLIQILKASTR